MTRVRTVLAATVLAMSAVARKCGRGPNKRVVRPAARKYMSRGAVALLLGVTVLVGPSGSPAQAHGVYCDNADGLVREFGYGNYVVYQLCVTHVSSRGYRGYVSFYPGFGRCYQLAGRQFVTLNRNGVRVAKSVDYVNWRVCEGTTMPTPYVQTGTGTYCVKAWDRRTSTTNDLIGQYCHSLS